MNKIILLLILVVNIYAAQKSTDDFSTEFNGGVADSLNTFQSWPDTISIYKLRRDYVSVFDNKLNDGSFTNIIGSYPVVQTPAVGVVDVVFNSWDVNHVGVSVNEVRAILKRRYTVSKAGVIPVETVASQDENPVDPAYYGGLTQQYPPNSIDFTSSVLDDYTMIWGSVTSGPVRTTNEFREANFATSLRGVNVETVVTESQLGGNPSISYSIRGSYNNQVYAYALAGRDGANNYRALVKKESLPSRLEIIRDTITAASGSNVLMRSFQVRSDSNGTVVVSWMESNNIYAQVYDQNLAIILPATLVVNTNDIEIKNPLTEVNSPFFSVANLVNDKFIYTYGRGGDIFYKTWDVGINSLGAEQQLTNTGANHWPSVDAENGQLAFGYFGDYNGGTDRAQLALFEFGATGVIVPSSRKDTALVSFDTQFTHSYGTRVHNFDQVKVSVDSIGGVAAGFNHEDNAWLSIWTYKPYYADTSFYRSNILTFDVSGVIEPWQGSDSIYLHSASFSTDSLVDLRFLQSANSGSMVPSLADFIAPHALDSVAPSAVSGRYYQYEFSLKASGLFRIAPEIDILDLEWNAKPRLPDMQSYDINSVNQSVSDTIDLMALKDTVLIDYSYFDYSAEDSLKVFHSFLNVLDSQQLGNDNNGFFNSSILLNPLDTVGLVLFECWTVDTYGAQSAIDTLWIRYRNDNPQGVLNWVKENGLSQRDTSTFLMTESKVYTVNNLVQFVGTFSDSNVQNLNLDWSVRGAGVSGSESILSNVQFTFDIPVSITDSNETLPGPNAWKLDADTLEVSVNDGKDTVVYIQPFTINHLPWFDSVATIGYGSPRIDSVIDVANSLPGRDGITIVPYQPSRLMSFANDSDLPNGDSLIHEWYLVDLDTFGVCCVNRVGPIATDPFLDIGDAQLSTDVLNVGDQVWSGLTALKSFYDRPPLIINRVIDGEYYSHEDTLSLYYSILDTTKNPYFGSAVDYLVMDLDYAAGGSQLRDTVEVVIHSTGTIPLSLFSAKTFRNQGLWLDIDWVAVDSLLIENNTDSSWIDSGMPVTIPSGDSLIIRFLVDISSMRGDFLIRDTLVIEANDFLRPNLEFPFELKVSDMPLVDFKIEELATVNRDKIELDNGEIPILSRIEITFSEPVLKDSVLSSIEIYSALDSMVRYPAAYENIPSLYSPFIEMNDSRNANNIVITGYTDTVYFRPNYLMDSDSLMKNPPAGIWIPKDQIRLKISNSILDTLGNPLDLERDRTLRDPGTSSLILSAVVDSSVLEVDTSKFVPKVNGSFDADENLIIGFNAPIKREHFFEDDTLISIDTLGMAEGIQKTVRIFSSKIGGRSLPLRSIELINSDSALIVRPMRRFYAGDTLRVRVMSNISDIYARTLDGNQDGDYDYLFDFNDSLDFYEYEFIVGSSKFYTFPNPYRAYEESHQEVGGISFKNLSLIKGFNKDSKWELGLYDMTGQKINRVTLFDPKDALAIPPEEYVWNVKNQSGRHVASGSYLYIFYSNDKVVKKGKVALIR
jgi:hypothetical protein